MVGREKGTGNLGEKENLHALELVQSELTLDNLFG